MAALPGSSTNRMNVRIIPRLDIKGPNLVKGIHLEGLRVLGKPEQFARLYYEQGADELLYMDVVASLYQRNSLLDMINRTSREVFIPLTVGGGLRTLEDIRAALGAGADKVSLNTAVINRPELIREAARRFGSSTIVISIESIRKADGQYEAYTDNGRHQTGVDAVQWARRVADLGAGEIMVTSIDREGTGKGCDIELTRQISESVTIPIIACGGVGGGGHIRDVIINGQADAICLSSILHYNILKRHRNNDEYYDEGNIEYLKKLQGFSNIPDASLPEIKEYLIRQGISCRPSPMVEVHD